MAAAAPPSGSSPTQPGTSPAPARTGRPPRRRRVKWIIGAAILLALAIAGFGYWREARQFTSTDDAYVQAHQVEITALVTGTVHAVHVVDQQKVKEGDALFDI